MTAATSGDVATRALRVGTRASALARTQSGLVADAMSAALARATVLVDVRTHGDVSTAPLSTIGGTGVFVSALRAALLDGRVDVAVHSLKDLPTAPAEGVRLAAVPRREDPRDALVARDGLTLDALPRGARVGTGSPRRAAMLAGRGLEIVDIRGNVDSRLARVGADLDAVVVAAAGLSRLGRLAEATDLLDPDEVPPAPGQGALAVETRAEDPIADLIATALDDEATRLAVTLERALLAALEAGCSAPVGALAVPTPHAGAGVWSLDVRAAAAPPARPGDSTRDAGVVRVRTSVDVAGPAEAASHGTRLGRELAERTTARSTSGSTSGTDDRQAGAP